jgi:hypothetical protein
VTSHKEYAEILTSKCHVLLRQTRVILLCRYEFFCLNFCKFHIYSESLCAIRFTNFEQKRNNKSGKPRPIFIHVHKKYTGFTVPLFTKISFNQYIFMCFCFAEIYTKRGHAENTRKSLLRPNVRCAFHKTNF